LGPHEQTTVLIRNPKQRGEWAEAQFMAKAAGHGLAVCKPWGDSGRYDFVVESEGGFLRVQVKSTMCRKDGGYTCKVRPNPRSRPYTSDQFDFVAAYVIPEDVWYIIPSAKAVRGIRGAIFLSPSSGHKYAPYREAWHLLR
jgi:hypothetical protein